MGKKDISITICTLGFVDTKNVMTSLEEFKPGVLTKFQVPVADPSETALNVIKGGAQRWKNMNYPNLPVSLFTNLYHIMPETVAALLRYMWE